MDLWLKVRHDGLRQCWWVLLVSAQCIWQQGDVTVNGSVMTTGWLFHSWLPVCRRLTADTISEKFIKVCTETQRSPGLFTQTDHIVSPTTNQIESYYGGLMYFKRHPAMTTVHIQHRQLSGLWCQLEEYHVLVMTSQSYTVHSKPHPKAYPALTSTVL